MYHIPTLHTSSSALRTAVSTVLVLITSTACADPSRVIDVPATGDGGDPDADRHAAAALSSIDDVLFRILPALGEAAAVEPLRAQLTELSVLLAVGDWPIDATAVTAAQRALDDFADTAGADEAELDAMRLALQAAATVLP
jgi:hypothetical protein